MEKRITRERLIAILPAVLFSALLISSCLFLASFLRNTWRALDATAAVLALKNEVVMESLDRGRFDRVIRRIKEKTKERAIDWKKLRNPF